MLFHFEMVGVLFQREPATAYANLVGHNAIQMCEACGGSSKIEYLPCDTRRIRDLEDGQISLNMGGQAFGDDQHL